MALTLGLLIPKWLKELITLVSLHLVISLVALHALTRVASVHLSPFAPVLLG